MGWTPPAQEGDLSADPGSAGGGTERTCTQPTLLYEQLDVNGSPVHLHPTANPI